MELPDTDEAEEEYAWKVGEPKYIDSFSETDPEDADYVKVLQLINEFLPVKELAGQIINLPVLRQFGLVENEKLDRFLATALGKPQKPEWKFDERTKAEAHTRQHQGFKIRITQPRRSDADGEENLPPALYIFKSRWPISSGGGLQSRRGWCNSSTGFQFSSIGVERYTPVFQTGIQGALP